MSKQVTLVISDSDFDFSREEAKRWITQRVEKSQKTRAALVWKLFNSLVETYQFETGSLKRVLTGQLMHPIDAFFRMQESYQRYNSTRALSSIWAKGYILARLIQGNCQPKNYVRVQRATEELIKTQRELDLFVEPKKRMFAERGFNNLKAIRKGASSTAAKKEPRVKELKLLVEHKSPSEWSRAIVDKYGVSKILARKWIERYLKT